MKQGKLAKGILVAAMVIGVGMVSCKKEKVVQPSDTVATRTVNDLPSDTIVGVDMQGRPIGSNAFTFFSIENNVVVPQADSATAKWDIAFKGSLIIVNGGNSGPATAGAFVWTGVFGDLKEIPVDSVIKSDNAPSNYAITFGSGKGWYSYNPMVNLLTPIPGRVIVLKTTKGNYAKIEILNYYRGGVTPDPSASDDLKTKNQRFMKFRFSLQANGSKKFE